MIPLSILNWMVMTLSIFNTILTLWLGLTILLNTEHRTWGVWLTGGGFLIGGAFFVSHTAIFGYGLKTISQELDFWWRLGWIPVIISPLAWYLAMLWYAGFWNRSDTTGGVDRLRQRHTPWLLLSLGVVVLLVGLLVFANPLPSYTQVAQLRLSNTPTIGHIPLLILAFPLYIVLCIVLSLDALRYPAPSERMMGELARRRAWPWLIAAALVFLVVSLLVAWLMFWIISMARYREITGHYLSMTRTLAWFDLIISGLIAGAIILVGRAIVSYEVFTGRTLPRRGFFRHWRNVVILAAGYGILGGGSLTYDLRPIYNVLIITFSIAPFYALFSWRSYVERKRYIAQLRPFVSSQRLYEHLLTSTRAAPPDVDAQTPFQALCSDILGAQHAFLISVGPLAPLVGPPLTYPNPQTNLPVITGLIDQLASPQTMGIALDPQDYGGAIWAVPLWSERGLIGLLLLGEKRDGGLYTQEEIEVAQASGERLIDTQASAEIARRLMSLQRQRLTESHVLDRRTRQVLHDDILPDLHAAMLTLSGTPTNGASTGTITQTVNRLADVHHQIADLLRDMPGTLSPTVKKRGLFGALQQVVDEELDGLFDEVSWQINGSVVERAAGIPTLVAEVLFYATREVLRNAAHHARPPDSSRSIKLTLSASWDDALMITILDTGIGMDMPAASARGCGQGLALHSTMMAVIGGTLTVDSVPNAYTCVTLTLPGNG